MFKNKGSKAVKLFLLGWLLLNLLSVPIAYAVSDDVDEIYSKNVGTGGVDVGGWAKITPIELHSYEVNEKINLMNGNFQEQTVAPQVSGSINVLSFSILWCFIVVLLFLMSFFHLDKNIYRLSWAGFAVVTVVFLADSASADSLVDKIEGFLGDLPSDEEETLNRSLGGIGGTQLSMGAPICFQWYDYSTGQNMTGDNFKDMVSLTANQKSWGTDTITVDVITRSFIEDATFVKDIADLMIKAYSLSSKLSNTKIETKMDDLNFSDNEPHQGYALRVFLCNNTTISEQYAGDDSSAELVWKIYNTSVISHLDTAYLTTEGALVENWTSYNAVEYYIDHECLRDPYGCCGEENSTRHLDKGMIANKTDSEHNIATNGDYRYLCDSMYVKSVGKHEPWMWYDAAAAATTGAASTRASHEVGTKTINEGIPQGRFRIHTVEKPPLPGCSKFDINLCDGEKDLSYMLLRGGARNKSVTLDGYSNFTFSAGHEDYSISERKYTIIGDDDEPENITYHVGLVNISINGGPKILIENTSAFPFSIDLNGDKHLDVQIILKSVTSAEVRSSSQASNNKISARPATAELTFRPTGRYFKTPPKPYHTYDVISNGGRWFSCDPNGLHPDLINTFSYTTTLDVAGEQSEDLTIVSERGGTSLITGPSVPINNGDGNGGGGSTNLRAENFFDFLSIDTFDVTDSSGFGAFISVDLPYIEIDGTPDDKIRILLYGFPTIIEETGSMVLNLTIGGNLTDITTARNIASDPFSLNVTLDDDNTLSTGVKTIEIYTNNTVGNGNVRHYVFPGAILTTKDVDKDYFEPSLVTYALPRSKAFLCYDEGGKSSIAECCGYSYAKCTGNDLNTPTWSALNGNASNFIKDPYPKIKRAGETIGLLQDFAIDSDPTANVVLLLWGCQKGVDSCTEDKVLFWPFPSWWETDNFPDDSLRITNWTGYDTLEFDIAYVNEKFVGLHLAIVNDSVFDPINGGTFKNSKDRVINKNQTSNYMREFILFEGGNVFDERVIDFSVTGKQTRTWHHVVINLSEHNLAQEGITMLYFYTLTNELREEVGNNSFKVEFSPTGEDTVKFKTAFGIDRILLGRESDTKKICAGNATWINSLEDDWIACESVAYTRWTGSHCCGDNQSKTHIESYNDAGERNYYGRACWQGNAVYNNTRISDMRLRPLSLISDYVDVLNVNGKYWGCNRNSDYFGSITDSESGEALVDYAPNHCDTRGGFFCGYWKGGYWNNETSGSVSNAIDRTDQKNLTLEIVHPELFINNRIPSSNQNIFDLKDSCCPNDYCWNGSGCVKGVLQPFDKNPVGDKPGDLDIGDSHNAYSMKFGFYNLTDEDNEADMYVCYLNGESAGNASWNITYYKEKWDNSSRGYCLGSTDCWTGQECVPNGWFTEEDSIEAVIQSPIENPNSDEGDHLCRDGNWSSRTLMIAESLYNVTTESGVSDFTIFCDHPDKSLNSVEGYEGRLNLDNNLTNNFCILEFLKGGEKKVVIGTSLNNYLNKSNMGPILDVFGFDDCDDSEDETTFFKCSESSLSIGKLFYDPSYKLVIYSREYSLIGVNHITGDKGIIGGFFSWVGGLVTKFVGVEELEETGLNLSKDFDRAYLSRKGDKTIDATVERTTGTKGYLSAKYVGFGDGVCDKIDSFVSGKGYSGNVYCYDGNIVSNGNFEDDDSGWETDEDVTLNKILKISKVGAYDSQSGLMYDIEDEIDGVFNITIQAEGLEFGQTYNVSLWYKGVGEISINSTYQSADVSEAGQSKTETLTESGTWKRYAFDLTPGTTPTTTITSECDINLTVANVDVDVLNLEVDNEKNFTLDGYKVYDVKVISVSDEKVSLKITSEGMSDISVDVKEDDGGPKSVRGLEELELEFKAYEDNKANITFSKNPSEDLTHISSETSYVDIRIGTDSILYVDNIRVKDTDVGAVTELAIYAMNVDTETDVFEIWEDITAELRLS